MHLKSNTIYTLFPAYMFVHSQNANIRESYVDTSCAAELVHRTEHKCTSASVTTQLHFLKC